MCLIPLGPIIYLLNTYLFIYWLRVKWVGIHRYDIQAILWLAWNHTATSFWPTAIPVWKPLKLLLRPEAFPRRKIWQNAFAAPLGELTALPKPLPGFKGPISKEGWEGRGRDWRGKERGKEKRGRGRKGGGEEGGKGKGHIGNSFPPLQALTQSGDGAHHWSRRRHDNSEAGQMITVTGRVSQVVIN